MVAVREDEWLVEETEISDDEEPQHVRYDIASFPTDFTVKVMYEKWRSDQLIIPDFQREYVWNLPQASRFIHALLDTGFEGALAAPSSLLDDLPGPAEFQGKWQLADARIIAAPVYVGDIDIGDLERLRIQFTVLGDEFILGRAIMNRYNVCFDHGQRVVVDP